MTRVFKRKMPCILSANQRLGPQRLFSSMPALEELENRVLPALVLETNTVLQAVQGTIATITPVQLKATDQSRPANQIAFTLVTPPNNGEIRKDGVSINWFNNPATGHFYRFTTATSWADAEKQAVAAGGHLVTINNQAENDWLLATFAGIQPPPTANGNIWIGLTDEGTEGHFRWTSGEAFVYSNWFGSEPNNDFGNENYGQFYIASGKWNDLADLGFPGSQGPMRGIIEVNSAPDNKFTQDDINNNRITYAAGSFPYSNDSFVFTVSNGAGGVIGNTTFNIAATAPVAANLTAQPNASTGGSLVTFTATLLPSPGNLGTVSFLDNGSAIADGSSIAVVNGVANFQTFSLTAGVHPISATYSGATGFAPATSNTLNFAVTAVPPKVVKVTPNGNIPVLLGTQRSRIASLVVVFDQPVQLDANAVALALHTKNVSYNGVAFPAGFGTIPNLAMNTTDKMTWTIAFSSNTDDGVVDGLNSIKDGVYDLNIAAAKVHPIGVPAMNMAVNLSTTFHRLFGDINVPTTPDGGVAGADYQAVVNTGDNLAFRLAFNNPPTYKAYFDANGDGAITGIVNTGDNLQFRNRFNKTLRWSI